MKRIKRGIFSGFWHALVEVPGDMMAQGVTNNPFEAIATSAIMAARPPGQDAGKADAQMVRIISEISAKLDKGLPDGPLGSLMKIVILGATVPAIIIEATKAYTEVNVKRPLDQLFRPELMGAMDVVATWREGVIDAHERDAKLALLGIPDDEQQYLVEISDKNPAFAELLAWYHGGGLAPGGKSKLGSSERLDEFKKLCGPSLLRSGVDLQDVDAMWWTHWQLPGFQTAIDMMRRGLIERADVDAIMERSQVLPAWRENMVKVTEQLLPLRSIAGMLHAKIVTPEQALKEYQAHGYAEDRAKLMLAYAQATDPANPDAAALHRRAKDLSESQTLAHYRDGLVPRADTKAALVKLGYDQDESETLLQLEDHGLIVQHTKDSVNKLRSLYLNAQASEQDAKATLTKLGLPSAYVDAQLASWKQEGALRVQLLDKSDVLGLYHKSVISDGEAAAQLARMGYSDDDVALLLDLHVPTAPKLKQPKGGAVA